MIANSLSRDEAKEQARERLPEILDQVLPGFRPERPFRCLNPSHEDRHPSMRYLSRSNSVRCFACGWHGDVFDVIGAVYGLGDGEAFSKTYDLLGMTIGKDGHRTVKRPAAKKPTVPTTTAPDREWAKYMVSIIYPPGWDKVEQVKLPKPLEILSQAETWLVGCLVQHPEQIGRCITLGLQGNHFDHTDLGSMYEDIAAGVPLDILTLDYLVTLKENALQCHMVKRVAFFIEWAGNNRMLDSVFTHVYSHWQNGDGAADILEELFAAAGKITGERYAWSSELDPLVVADEVFGRFFTDQEPAKILKPFRLPSSEPETADNDSDVCLVAACVFLGIEPAAILEKSAMLEYDSGMSRDEANREALAMEMKRLDRRYSRRLIHDFFDAAGPMLETEQAKGWSRKHTMAQIAAKLAEKINARA